MRVRIPLMRLPLFWRSSLLVFVCIVVMVSGLIKISQVGATGRDCISASMRQVDIARERLFKYHSKSWPKLQEQYAEWNASTGIPSVVAWAAHGNRYAYLEHSGNWGMVPTQLIITSPGEGLYRRFSMKSYIPNGNPIGYIWSGKEDGYHVPIQYLIWSPDGKYVLFAYYEDHFGSYQPAEKPRWVYSLFGVDGTAFYQFTSIEHQPDTLAQWRAVWSSDSRSVIFPQYGTAHNSTHRTRPMVLEVPSLRLYIAGNDRLTSEKRIAMPTRTDDKTTITLMNMDGTQSTPLIEGVDDVGDPSWSPDGQSIAVVWSTGREQFRKVRLTWARADGSDSVTLDDGFWDIRDLMWLKDGESLLYVARRKDGFRVEIADLDTGATRVLGKAFGKIARVQQYPTTGRISFWWQTSSGDYQIPDETGIATYEANGAEVYLTKLKRNILGLEIFPTPYQGLRWREVYRSPDGSIYAIRHLEPDLNTGRVSFGSMQLIAADGSWTRLVAENMTGFSDPIWSPDSKRLAFVEWNGYNPLRVVTAQGDPVQDIEALSGTTDFFWTPCG